MYTLQYAGNQLNLLKILCAGIEIDLSSRGRLEAG